MQTTIFDATARLAERLTKQSRDENWNVWTYFDWPETIGEDEWAMSPQLCSLYGTEMWDALTEAQQKKLSLFEIGNFFSLTLQGERPLVAGMSDRLYQSKVSPEATEYLHHFIDEENKHMVMFGMFCRRYLGKVYPEKKVALAQKYEKGEEEMAFFCKVLVVEELGDYYNIIMMRDEQIAPIVKQINWVHHRDESRHLGFGREHTKALWDHWSAQWSPETTARFREWLVSYVKSSWNDFYNPTMYKDAGIPDAYDVRQKALAHPATAIHRAKASKKLLGFFARSGILEEVPAV
ncbi:MAG: diiron oxygenase [Sandaracinus sp.]|nr:diiron oxygenase [Sandaracinus sp.]MCB9634251.1 diiron oxygenase [Sandaracinus sp.]